MQSSVNFVNKQKLFYSIVPHGLSTAVISLLLRKAVFIYREFICVSYREILENLKNEGLLNRSWMQNTHVLLRGGFPKI